MDIALLKLISINLGLLFAFFVLLIGFSILYLIWIAPIFSIHLATFGGKNINHKPSDDDKKNSNGYALRFIHFVVRSIKRLC